MTDASDPLHLRVRIDAAPDVVYRALTDSDELIDWFAESADVDLDAGKYQFWGRYAPQGDRPRQTLTGHTPGRELHFGWGFDEGESTVDITLTPDDGATVVDLVHAGVPTTGTADRTALGCFWSVTLANLVAQSDGVQTMPPFDFSVPAQGDALVRTVIEAPIEEVFAALLDPSQVDKWAGGSASIEPTVGGRYDIGWDHGPGQITELDQDKALAYTWRHPGSSDTLVRWALRGARGATYLTLVHTGFDNDKLAEEFRQGWPGFLVEIKRIHELGDDWVPLTVPA